VYELKRDGAKALAHVKLVNSDYCLNCYWRDLQGRNNFSYSSEQVGGPDPTLVNRAEPNPTAMTWWAAPSALAQNRGREAEVDRTDGLLEAGPGAGSVLLRWDAAKLCSLRLCMPPARQRGRSRSVSWLNEQIPRMAAACSFECMPDLPTCRAGCRRPGSVVRPPRAAWRLTGATAVFTGAVCGPLQRLPAVHAAEQGQGRVPRVRGRVPAQLRVCGGRAARAAAGPAAAQRHALSAAGRHALLPGGRLRPLPGPKQTPTDCHG